MTKSCPKCGSSNIRKNGHRGEKQNYQCKDCKRQFVEFYSEVGYSKEFKEECLKMYLNGLGFRSIEKIKKVNHNTVIRWVKEAANQIPETNNQDDSPSVAQLDEIQTFIGQKKIKFGYGQVLTSFVLIFWPILLATEVQKLLKNYGQK